MQLPREELLATVFVASPSCDNPKYKIAGNCLIETDTKTLLLGCNNSVIPNDDSVNTIASYAFFRCYNLETITLPKSLLEIEDYAFAGCEYLEYIR